MDVLSNRCGFIVDLLEAMIVECLYDKFIISTICAILGKSHSYDFAGFGHSTTNHQGSFYSFIASVIRDIDFHCYTSYSSNKKNINFFTVQNKKQLFWD